MAITFSSSVVALAEAIHQTKCFKPSMLALHIFNCSHSACSGVCGTPRLGAGEAPRISETKNSGETSNFTQNASIESAPLLLLPTEITATVARRRLELKSPWRCTAQAIPLQAKLSQHSSESLWNNELLLLSGQTKKWGARGEGSPERLEKARLQQLRVINLIFAII